MITKRVRDKINTWTKKVLALTHRDAIQKVEAREVNPLGIMHSYDVRGEKEIRSATGHLWFEEQPAAIQCDHCHRIIKKGRMIQGLRFAPDANLCTGCIAVMAALIDNVPTEYEKQPAEIFNGAKKR